jgi:hypothetical protein
MEWWEQAACRNDGNDRWFANHLTIKETCELTNRCFNDCPSQEPCLLHALNTPEQFGIWGGYTQQELFAIRTKRYSRCRECGRRWPKAKLTEWTTCRHCLTNKHLQQQDRKRHD